MFIVTVLGIALLVGGVLTVYSRGSFLTLIGVLHLCFWVGLPSLCIAAVTHGFSKTFRHPAWTFVRQLSLSVTIFLAVQLACLPVGSYLGHRDVEEAKSFCERYGKQYSQGAYFTRSQLAKKSVPRLIDLANVESSPDGFYCHFSNPAGIMDLWFYDVDTESWHRD